MYQSVVALIVALTCVLVVGSSAELAGPWDLLWPCPSGTITTGTEMVQLAPESDFKFIDSSQSSGDNEILLNAFSRYKAILFKNNPQVAQGTLTLAALHVDVKNASQSLQLGVDESYNISVPSGDKGVAKLFANTTWGALRGLESFAQLVQRNANTETLGDALTINLVPLQFNDYPRFPHRGVLLDTARHYLPLDTILRTVDAIAWNKMNTLHWHITDAQSFPMEIPGVPELVKVSDEELCCVRFFMIFRGILCAGRIFVELNILNKECHSGCTIRTSTGSESSPRI